MDIVYEDNHIIIINKLPGEIVQGDKTGDTPLSEMVKEYIKEKYSKPGNVFCGVTHRIDRPVGGLVVFARTSKALERLNEMFRNGKVHKSYLAIIEGHPEKDSDRLTDWLVSNGRLNKTFVSIENNPNAKKSILDYKVLTRGDKYSLLEIKLLTGRKHQIRAQLANLGHPIKGDLKYGARRSNHDGSISLLAHKIEFIHPVSQIPISLQSPLPQDFQKFIPEIKN